MAVGLNLRSNCWLTFPRTIGCTIYRFFRPAARSSIATAKSWELLYAEDFTKAESEKIIDSLKQSIEQSDFKIEKTWGEQIEDRGSQITFSALGQEAPLDAKKTWDPDFAKRQKMKTVLDKLIPEFSVHLGGATSVDVTKPGIDKAYGIHKLKEILGIPTDDMIFVGDAIFPGGNDYPAKQAGVQSIQVRDPEECKRVIEAISACLRVHINSETCGMTPFQLHRLGTLMEPEPGNPHEELGVLNPAAVRGRDGQLYLFPRLVAKGNYSRIGIARVLFDKTGNPTGVERLGIALEPEADYEKRPNGAGGCEDPRITFVEPLGHYAMTYVAFSPSGPRIAIAISKDLMKWTRIGLATFTDYEGIEFDGVDNKDSCLFPVSLPNPAGQSSLALVHRPIFPGTSPEEKAEKHPHHVHDLQRESVWISYRLMSIGRSEISHLTHFAPHRLLAAPAAPWEQLKIGVGCPPVLTRHGWMVVYHGVSDVSDPKTPGHYLQYAAGVMILDKDHPSKILYRSPDPILTPCLPAEQIGTIGHVVFPHRNRPPRRHRSTRPLRRLLRHGRRPNRCSTPRGAEVTADRVVKGSAVLQ